MFANFLRRALVHCKDPVLEKLSSSLGGMAQSVKCSSLKQEDPSSVLRLKTTWVPLATSTGKLCALVGKTRMPGALWPTSLAKMASSKFSERRSLNWSRHLTSTTHSHRHSLINRGMRRTNIASGKFKRYQSTELQPAASVVVFQFSLFWTGGLSAGSMEGRRESCPWKPFGLKLSLETASTQCALVPRSGTCDLLPMAFLLGWVVYSASPFVFSSKWRVWWATYLFSPGFSSNFSKLFCAQDPSPIPSLSKFLLSFFCLQIWAVIKDWALWENILWW